MQEVLERKSIKNIDFNCDLAQAYGIYRNNNEYELLDYVSSVNISCGFHAGDPLSIKEALLKAKEKNVAAGFVGRMKSGTLRNLENYIDISSESKNKKQALLKTLSSGDNMNIITLVLPTTQANAL